MYNLWEHTSKDINNLKNYLKNITQEEKNIIQNIIIFKKIYKLIQDNSTQKIQILLPVYNKYKQKLISRFYIFNILKIDQKTIKILNKELFKMKSPEDQRKIKQDYYNKIKARYHSMTQEQKKLYNKKRVQKKITKMGYNNYKKYCLDNYKKWYHNLSKEKKLEYSNKRKERYSKLDEDTKQKYKENKQIKLSIYSIKERKEKLKKYLETRNKKINNMTEEEKKIYYDKLKLRKKTYFDNTPIQKRKINNKIRTYKRQLDKKKISIEEYQKKKIIIKETMIL
jgi:hypothetical protein